MKKRKSQRRKMSRRWILVVSILLGIFLLLLLDVQRLVDVVSIAPQEQLQLQLLQERKDCNVRQKPCGRCPELLEAAKYYRHHFSPPNATLPSWRVQMIQLVGQWPHDDAKMERTMQHVFTHNQEKIVRFMTDPSQPLQLPPIAITEPPRIAAACRHTTFPPDASPAYWKVMAIHQTCTTTTKTPRPDLVWFLDGDALIMDTTARVEFLWAGLITFLETFSKDGLSLFVVLA